MIHHSASYPANSAIFPPAQAELGRQWNNQPNPGVRPPAPTTLYIMIQHLKFLSRFGNHYETPLLIQSVLMNIAMFALVHLCVNINTREVIIKMEERVFTGMYRVTRQVVLKVLLT